MNVTPEQNASAFGDLAAGFAARPPSQAWEPLPWSDDGQQFAWVWFKPPAVPQGAILRIPEEAWQASQNLAQLTLRRLLLCAGIDPASVAMWQIYGLAYHGMNGTNPLLDQFIPAPPPGVVPEVAVYIAAPQWNPAIPPSVPQAMPNANLAELFERIDAEWTAALDIEKDLDRLRKMLVDLGGRLKVLNRDLSSDERLYSSREDKQEWQDAKRMLRDSENRLRACIKDFDIGDSSSAGYRRMYEQIHHQFIVPRIPFEGIESMPSQFEFYRKLVVTLQGKMNGAYLTAQNSAERRASSVLARIAAKVREAQTKKTALGVMLDG